MEIKVIQDKKLSKEYDKRYVVVDINTGDVLDNAQGYGYKTIQGAYAAYGYKHRDKSKDKEKAKERRKIRAWMKSHEDFMDLMQEIAFDIEKGGDPNEKIDTNLVKEVLKAQNLHPDFSAYALLREWKKC